MATTDFFVGQTEQSRVKARIVSKYFDGWSNVLGPVARKRGQCIQYADLFAGPGRYEDGAESTPLLILRMAIAKPKIHDIFCSVFNDADPANAEALREKIDALPGIGLLKHRPQVYNDPVDERITSVFEGKRLPPTLTFIDPFGYKGLSMRLIQAALKDWGCDCVFFFNFNRVNAAIHNKEVERHVAALFDAEDARQLRGQFEGLPPQEREEKVIGALEDAVKRKNGRHVLHFRFLNDAASRTSHHLVFATKHPLGGKIMKDIMGKESSWSEGGVPSFVCSPKPKHRGLYDVLEDAADGLEEVLLETFAGRTLSVGEIYEQHGLSRRFMPRNYKEALLRLEASGRITVASRTGKRQAGRMADHLLVTFPKKDA